MKTVKLLVGLSLANAALLLIASLVSLNFGKVPTRQNPISSTTFQTKTIQNLPDQTHSVALTPTKPRAPTPTPAAAVKVPDCLVVINGQSYDLGAFRAIHGGGDIFQCNTDMTSIFLSQHPSSYQDRLAAYKL